MRRLVQGKVPSVNRAGSRIPRHLFILPGGIAEIFTSKPKSHCIVFKSRKGLVKLSIETGAEIVPCYVFGGTDFFSNLSTGEGWLSRISRRLRVGVTIFWGYLFLPLPYTPKVTMVIGDPIPVPKILKSGDGEEADRQAMQAAVDSLHKAFIDQIFALFDKYKTAAGYPEAVLSLQ